MDPTARLRLATRLHFMLRRQLDQDFDIAILLQGGFEARAALRLCRSSGRPELVAAARELELAHRAEAKAIARRTAAAVEQPVAKPTIRTPKPAKKPLFGGRKAQDLDWSKDTSGFGLSLPPERDGGEPEWPQAKTGWLARLGIAPRGD